MHDARFEERLRAALRAEGDSLPLTVTVEQLELRLRERRGGRLAARSVAAIAAVLAIAVVGGVAILTAGRGSVPPVGGSLSPSHRALESVAELHRVAGVERPIVLTGERVGDPGVAPDVLRSYPVGELDADVFHHVVHTCSGPGPFSLTLTDPAGATTGLWTYESCSDGPEVLLEGAQPSAAVLSVVASPNVSWRLIVVTEIAPSVPPDGLPEPPAITTDPLFERVASIDLLDGDRRASLPVTLPDGVEEYFVAISCVGGGAVEVDTPALPIRHDCGPVPGTLTRETLVPPAAASFDLPVRTVGAVRARVVVEAYDLDANPNIVFLPPAATLSARTTVETASGCGLSFELANGHTASDSCGPAYPVMPPDRTLTVAPGEELTFELEPGWTITGVTGHVVATDDVVDAPDAAQFAPLDRCCDTGEAEPAKALLWAPTEPGDWTVELSISAWDGEDRFSLPYYARIVVDPGTGG